MNFYSKSILDIGVTLKQMIVNTFNFYWIFILAFSILDKIFKKFQICLSC